MANVVIVGAGLTGLSVAYHLELNNFFDYEIIEQHERPGGLLRSFKQDGFTFDFTGHLLHSNDQYFTSLLNTIVGAEHFLHVQRNAAIFSHNVYTPYPFQSNLHNLPPAVIDECVQGFINRNEHDAMPKNFHAWVMKYFGAGIGKHFFFPYNSKLLASPVEQITPSWTGRFVPQTTLQDIIHGAQPLQNARSGYNSSFMYPKRGGIEFIITKLKQALKKPITLRERITHVDATTKTVSSPSSSRSYKTLISTMPLTNLLTMTKTPSTHDYNEALRNLTCNAVINFNIGFDRAYLSDKHWIYFPEEAFPFYRLGFWNNINPTSVAPNCSAIYGELSYMPGTMTEQDKQSITQNAIKKALDFLQVRSDNIVTQKILHLDHAYVLYNDWREQHLSSLLARLQDHNIYSIGRFGAWKYSSMQEAVLEGKEIAERIIRDHTPHIHGARYDNTNIGHNTLYYNEK